VFYILYPYLRELFSPFNVLRYITVRSAFAAVTSFLLLVLIGPKVIRALKKRNIVENVERYMCEDMHRHKANIPTMGGVLIIIAVVVSTLLWANIRNRLVWLALGITLWMGVIGFIDDYIKTIWRDKRGIVGRYKLALQAIGALALGIYLYTHPMDVGALWHYEIPNSDYTQFINGRFSCVLAVPFFKDVFIPLGAFYILFVMVVLLGSTNSVNITDGEDGLAIGALTTCLLVYGMIAYVTGNWKISRYLQVLFVEGSGELAVFCAGIVGAGLGFLWFNAHPAEIFMGDTGALALGGALGTVALITKQELLLPLVGGVFVIEIGSVILQVASYKLRGKRIFKMAPLHHHFEKLGWAESKIVVRFWILSLIFALAALSTLKLR